MIVIYITDETFFLTLITLACDVELGQNGIFRRNIVVSFPEAVRDSRDKSIILPRYYFAPATILTLHCYTRMVKNLLPSEAFSLLKFTKTKTPRTMLKAFP